LLPEKIKVHIPTIFHEKLYIFNIEVPNTTRLSDILNILKEKNVEVVSLATLLFNERVRVSLILTPKEPDISVEDVVSEMFKISEHISYDVMPYEIPLPGRCPIEFHGMRVVMIGKPILKALVEDVKKWFGEDSGSSFLWHLGHHGGVGVAKEIERSYGFRRIENYFATLRIRGITLGWFVIDSIEIIEGTDVIKIILRMSDNWECKLAGKNADKPQSHFVRGVLSGFTSYILKKEVIAKEVKCIAMGDPYCEFLIVTFL